MLPLILRSDHVAGLCGAGEALERRRDLLRAAGMSPVIVAPDANTAELEALSVLFIAGLGAPEGLAGRARAAGVLVNVEDVPALCDFHVPAMVRRGDLLLTVSTGGRAPGVARFIRRWLEQRFGGEWSGRLAQAEAERQRLRAEGLSMAALSGRMEAFLNEKGWLS